MLPPKEMLTHCLRCKHALGDERICENCGADREVEVEVARELVPAIAGLRRWLVVVAALLLVYAWLLYDYTNRAGPLVIGLLAVVGVFAVCAAVVERAPLMVASIAAGIFFAEWLTEIAAKGAWALAPGWNLILRVLSAAVLLDGLRFALKARRIRERAKERVPRATARTRQV